MANWGKRAGVGTWGSGLKGHGKEPSPHALKQAGHILDSETTEESKPKGHFSRYRQIVMVLVKYRLNEVIRTLKLGRYLPFGWVPPAIPWLKRSLSKPVRARMALEELGTTFVKLGQIISTRGDLVPPDYLRELSKLQDSLKQLDADVIKVVLADDLGKRVDQVFASFEPVAIGVASIGQVHAASLGDGTQVVVKIQKPGVPEQVEEDMRILRELAVDAAKDWDAAEHYDLVGMVRETAETLIAEMDYVREGRSAEYFARFFESDPSVHIPKIFWDTTTSRVLTMERIRGIGISNVEALDKAGFDRKKLAKRTVDLWLKMVFEGDVFHADPHPGNLFMEPDGRLGLIDFGMTSTIENDVREHLTGLGTAILEHDVDLLVDSLIDLGAVPTDVRRDSLRADLKHVMGHYPRPSTMGLQTGLSLGELPAVLRRNHVQLPSNTFLLLKTLAMAHGLGLRLDPDFDVLPLLETYVQRKKVRAISLSDVVSKLPSALTELVNLGTGLPRRMNRLLKSLERGEMKVRTDVDGLERHLEHLERLVNRAVGGIILAAIILGLAIVFLALRLGH